MRTRDHTGGLEFHSKIVISPEPVFWPRQVSVDNHAVRSGLCGVWISRGFGSVEIQRAGR